MLGDISKVNTIYIVCGYTDMRKSIDGLVAIVKQTYDLDPFENSLFLFCGKRGDRLKTLHWEKNGFIMMYKRLESGRFQWPQKYAIFLGKRLDGSWKVSRLISQRHLRK